MEKNKHLTGEDRKFIEDSLNHKMSYASIAQALGKDPTTIYEKSPTIVQCHLDKDINKGAKKTDGQRKVVSFLLSREISTNRYAKQSDGSICFRKVYNTIVRLLCRGSLLPTGI